MSILRMQNCGVRGDLFVRVALYTARAAQAAVYRRLLARLRPPLAWAGQRGHRTGSHCLMCCLPFSTSAEVEKLNVYKSGRQVQKHLVGE